MNAQMKGFIAGVAVGVIAYHIYTKSNTAQS